MKEIENEEWVGRCERIAIYKIVAFQCTMDTVVGSESFRIKHNHNIALKRIESFFILEIV